MKGRVKTTFLILSTVCFVAMASGGLLYLHLAPCVCSDHHENSDHHEEPVPHDCKHCPICQQLLLSKKNFTVDPEPAGAELERIGRLPARRQAPPILQAFLTHTHPRAPPA